MKHLLHAFLHPVSNRTQDDIRAAGARLDLSLRVSHQAIGQMEEGCGATIGVMPRCDFACRGCYLGGEANATPPLPIGEVRAQMRLLRTRLGANGNLQLTDGEVTLRPEGELTELIRYARSIGLLPMLMTHGETFRRRPGLLERLMVEGGLTEISIHIDTTQRGRDADFSRARTEQDLMPLRAEFAGIVRRARRSTGRPLRAASTCTVTPDNLDAVTQVVRWFKDHADAFRFVSFLPAAQVGRSRPGLGGHVSQEDVWERVAAGLMGEEAGPAERAAWIDRQWWVGHPDCSRLMTGLVCDDGPRGHRYEPVGPRGADAYARMFTRLTRRWGGVAFRDGRRADYAARLAGMAVRDPVLFGWTLPRAAAHLVRSVAPHAPMRLALRLLTRRARLVQFSVATHQFMSREELMTPRGQERVRNCIFSVPVDGRLVSMCEVNTLGMRDALYDRAAGRVETASSAALTVAGNPLATGG